MGDVRIGLPERGALNRRDWMALVVQASAIATLSPLASAAEHVHAAAAAAPAPDPNWQPVFFTPEQNESVIALGEAIIPGSRAALCNRVIDLILSIESEKTRKDFTAALSAFDSASRSGRGPTLAKLPPAQTEALLQSAAQPGAPLWPQFDLLKEWFSDAYWSSEPGLRELGWTGRVAWSKFAGCPNPASHT